MCPAMAGGDAGSARSDGLIRSLSDHGRDSLQVCRRTSWADTSPSRWPRGDPPVRTVAEEYARVVGVDTHAATHTMTLLIGATGAVVEHRTFPTSAAGLRRALTWIRNRTHDQPVWSWPKAPVPMGRGWPSISPRAGSSSPRLRPSPRRDPVAWSAAGRRAPRGQALACPQLPHNGRRGSGVNGGPRPSRSDCASNP